MSDRDILVNRLKEAGIPTQRFLKLQPRTKKAFEPEWQKSLYTPEQFSDYPFWGICAKDDLFFIDTDRTEMQDIIREKLPPTLEVQSPRRELSQFVFKSVGEPIPNKDLILPCEEDGAGEIRAQNLYIVAAGTEIDFQDLVTGEPRSGTYRIIQDRPIATVESAAFMQIITPYLGKDTTQKITYEHMRQGVLAGRRHAMGIKYANFLVGVQKFDAPTALRAMEEWNTLCVPPMPQEDIERMVRDAINYQSTRPKQPEPLMIEPETEIVTLEQVKQHYSNWLYLEKNDDVLDVVLATVCDRRLSGDPVWLFLISASGGTKTEIVRNMCGPDVYSLDSLTPHTLVSGKVDKDEKPIRGILEQIDGKVLIIKDFTVILNKRREDRDEIFSQLRSLYDGYIEHAYGAFPEPIRINAKIGLIAACVPAIEVYQKLYIILGERFLTIRHRPNRLKATIRALNNMGKEEIIRGELCGVTTSFLKNMKPKEIKLALNIRSEVLKLADAVAKMRCPVPRSLYQGENDIAPSIEYPTRIAKQLLKLSKLLALVRGKDTAGPAELKTVRRVARDSCIQNRLKILQILNDKQVHTTRQIADQTNMKHTTCWTELKEMQCLDLVASTDEGEENNGFKLQDESLLELFKEDAVEEQTRLQNVLVGSIGSIRIKSSEKDGVIPSWGRPVNEVSMPPTICCPTCRGQGKEMTFVTDIDFQAHHRAFHESRGNGL